MSEAERKRWIAARGQCKASITRLENYLNTDKIFTIEDLGARKHNLKETYAKYQEISVSLQLLSDENDCDEGEIEERYLQLIALIELKKKSLAQDPGVSIPVTHQAHLPLLDVPVFDGKCISSYKPFYEMFTAVVHNNLGLSNIQRLCYLKKFLKGEPLQLIDSLPIIGESYASAIDLLQKRYNNPPLLVNSHVTSLLDLPAIQRGTASELRNFVASVRQHITSLKNYKQPVDEWNSLLTCILLRKVDSFTARLFHSDRVATAFVTNDELLSFLEKRAAALEASPMNNKFENGVKFATNRS
ncbi:uncharacterized protein [Choristoneura fumiferana]|uniref:uncharacterized protein n=1 Tax=Choristoneura fumiferana TaxID=7141 RepID=UPI003D1580F4